jgi:hypothetical protein
MVSRAGLADRPEEELSLAEGGVEPEGGAELDFHELLLSLDDHVSVRGPDRRRQHA